MDISKIQNLKNVKSEGGGSKTASFKETPATQEQTDPSVTIDKITSQMNAIPDVDKKKVLSVKKALEDGSFLEDTEATAEGMIKESVDAINSGLKNAKGN